VVGATERLSGTDSGYDGRRQTMRYKVFGKRTGLRVSELGDTEPSRTRRGACSTAMSKPAEISSTP
jgi:hypothetical protein